MRVWVITGDKQATAINIGYSSRLLKPDMEARLVVESGRGESRISWQRAASSFS